MPRLIAILVCLAVLGGVARAQPTAEDKAEAKQAFQRAEAAERRKDWRTAIDEYQRAYDRVPHADVLFNIALNFERIEEYRDAVTYYRRYLDEKPDAQDRARVEALIDKLRVRPGRVTITSEPTGAAVTIDGRRAGVTPLEVPLAGAHRIELAGDGAAAARDVTVEYGEPQAVHVALRARVGVLVVNSNVAGARVAIDGADAGVTPLRVELPAGPHRVVVVADGWASHERPVDVPAEGSTQVTANLVRPLGYVEPPPETVAPRTFLVFSGGADTTGELGGLYQILFGVHRGRIDGALGYGFLQGGAAFVLEARYGLTRTKVRPYLKASAALGSSSTITGSVGVLASLGVGPRARTGVFVDVGVGYGRTAAMANAGEDASLIVPLIGGVQISY